MANTTKKFDSDVSTSYDIKDWRKNINFLQHLIGCIQGKKDPEVVKATVNQLQKMIDKIKKKVQTKKENSNL